MGLTAIVLGAAAGGGFPQWNCNCDVCRLAGPAIRAPRRTQTSLAVSADGDPLDPAQRLARSPRSNPDDPSAAPEGFAGQSNRSCGVDGRRDRPDRRFVEPARTITVHADGDSSDACCVADNPMFGALASDVVSRRAITPARNLLFGAGCRPSFSWFPENCRSISRRKSRHRRGKRGQCRSQFSDGNKRYLHARRCRDNTCAAHSGRRAPMPSCSTARSSPMTK